MVYKAELRGRADSETPSKPLMQPMYYIGLDMHKLKISYCVKDSGGKVYAEGWIPATRFDLDRWMKALPQLWSAHWKRRCSPAGSDVTRTICLRLGRAFLAYNSVTSCHFFGYPVNRGRF